MVSRSLDRELLVRVLCCRDRITKIICIFQASWYQVALQGDSASHPAFSHRGTYTSYLSRPIGSPIFDFYQRSLERPKQQYLSGPGVSSSDVRLEISTQGLSHIASSGLRVWRLGSQVSNHTRNSKNPYLLRGSTASDSMFCMMIPSAARAVNGSSRQTSARSQNSFGRLLGQSYNPLPPAKAPSIHKQPPSQGGFQWNNGPVKNNNEIDVSLSNAPQLNSMGSDLNSGTAEIQRWHRPPTRPNHSLSKYNSLWSMRETKSPLISMYRHKIEPSKAKSLKRSRNLNKALPTPCRQKKHGIGNQPFSTVNSDNSINLCPRPHSASNSRHTRVVNGKKSGSSSEPITSRKAPTGVCTSQDIIDATVYITNNRRIQSGNVMNNPPSRNEPVNGKYCRRGGVQANNKTENCALYPSSSSRMQEKCKSRESLAVGKYKLRHGNSTVFKSPNLVTVGTQKLPVAIPRIRRAILKSPKKANVRLAQKSNHSIKRNQWPDADMRKGKSRTQIKPESDFAIRHRDYR